MTSLSFKTGAIKGQGAIKSGISVTTEVTRTSLNTKFCQVVHFKFGKIKSSFNYNVRKKCYVDFFLLLISDCPVVSNYPQPAPPIWCNTQTPEMLIK